jgi:hypothetical protein
MPEHFKTSVRWSVLSAREIAASRVAVLQDCP